MSVLKGIAIAFLEWAFGKVYAYLKARYQERKSDKEAEERAKRAVENIDKAKTDDEFDDAIRDSLK